MTVYCSIPVSSTWPWALRSKFMTAAGQKQVSQWQLLPLAAWWQQLALREQFENSWLWQQNLKAAGLRAKAGSSLQRQQLVLTAEQVVLTAEVDNSWPWQAESDRSWRSTDSGWLWLQNVTTLVLTVESGLDSRIWQQLILFAESDISWLWQQNLTAACLDNWMWHQLTAEFDSRSWLWQQNLKAIDHGSRIWQQLGLAAESDSSWPWQQNSTA